ncbi:MAG: RluA family pseudouridine synthase [Ruminococcaceae bacterium]|nr:RluA family pseudouridine synthase [Oscillospiraceae bacterium]
MRILEYIVPEEFSDRPVLHFLKGHLKLSTKIVQSLRHTEGSVTSNDRIVRMIDNVYKDETVVIRIPEKSTPPLLCEMDLDIIFEDEDILVLNKPAGISAHPTRRHPNGTLANGVADYIIKNGGSEAAGRAIGRLDKGTSGVIVFAKNSLSAYRLNGNIEKTYYALVKGDISDSGTIDTPIYRPDPNKTLRAVSTEREDALPATTHWQIEKRCSDKALLKVNIETGRTHQIRVHFSSIGFPLLGDDMYGGEITENLSRPGLHCGKAELIHPTSGEKMIFHAELAEDITKELGIRN